MSAQLELTRAVDWAIFQWWEEQDTRTWDVHSDEACPCTVQVDNPDNVHMWISFTCPRHGEHARMLRERFEAR